MLHWGAAASGKGALFTGDTIYVARDCRHVSFMYSYPNLIPVNAATVRQIVNAVEPYAYDRIYAAWDSIAADAKQAVHRSADRYIQHIQG